MKSDISESEKQKWQAEKVKWKVASDDFEMIDSKPIASTNQSIVYLVCQKSKENRKCVMKKTKFGIKSIDHSRYFNREIQILAKYHHPAIVPFIGYNERQEKKRTQGYIYLLNIEKGTLSENIARNNKEGEKDPLWDDAHKFIITFGVACVMEFLHSNNIIHRDLKPENILLDSKLQPYVTDFGTAKDIIVGNSIHQTIQGATAYIMAPEFLKETDKYKNTPQLDVYAFGITMYHLWTGIFPFLSYIDSNQIPNDFKMTRDVMNGYRPQIPNGTPKNIANLIEHSWNQDFNERPTFTQIVDELLSPMFSEYNQNPVFKEYKEELEKYRPNHHQKLESDDPPCEQSLTSAQKKSGESSDTKNENLNQSSNFESPVIKSLIADTESGNLPSELELALALNNGTYGPADKETASEHFFNVANKSNVASDQGLAEYYYGIFKIEKKDYANAEAFLRRARRHGNADAAYTLTELISSGKIKDKSQNDTFSLLEMASKNGNKRAVKKLVSLLLNREFTYHSKNSAYSYIRIGSDLGDHEMMHKYSKILEYGMGNTEKNINEAMNLLNMLTDFNYAPAQVDLALHLLNGYNIEKDIDRAESILEIAASNNNFDAMLWYSTLVSSDKDRNEDSNHFFELSKNSNVVPEALAINGQMLVDIGQYEDAINSLIYGLKHGSTIAFISFGNICEKLPEHGDPEFFFKCAADHCHALDKCGFYFPFHVNVFHCIDCDIDICEGCAKSCHKNHSTIFISRCFGYDLKCKCGASGFGDPKYPKCTAESISCYDINKPGCIYQHMYQCETCCPISDSHYICKSCIGNCHRNHKIVDCGIQKAVCSCGMQNIPNNFKCILLKCDIKINDDCSLAGHPDEKIFQKWSQCYDCKVFGKKDAGICYGCVSDHHHDHQHRCICLGYNKFCCKCPSIRKCQYIG